MVTKKDLEDYRKIIADETIDLFNINIIFEILSNDDVDHISDNRLLAVANIVRDCYLKDQAGYQLSEIVNAVLLNFKDIQDQDLSPREILIKYL